jgi:hypothetical protein
MKDRRTFARVPGLIAALAVALLLLMGTYAVIASQVPFGAPDSVRTSQSGSATSWSSGWVFITPSTSRVFTHGLGLAPEQYAVEMRFLDTNGDLGINRRYYGSAEEGGNWYGAYWYGLTSDTISVYRQQEDGAADRIHIRVWVPPANPDADSGWLDIAAGETITYSHSLGITDTELTVSVWFSDTGLLGIHNYGYGGVAIDEFTLLEGAHWHDLTEDTVQVTRHPQDQVVDQVRVVVVHGAEEPGYDSLLELGDWQSVDPGDVYTFTHGLNWDPNMLLARGECYSSTVSGPGGIHHWLAGGNHHWALGWKGTNLQRLTRNTVQVYRQPDDDICPQVRVRVWKRSLQLYLPVVLSNYESP